MIWSAAHISFEVATRLNNPLQILIPTLQVASACFELMGRSTVL